MLPLLLLLIGGACSLYCLWQLRRWLGESEATASSASRRLETLVDELVATAETTVTLVEEKAEELSRVIARADERLARLDVITRAPAPAPAPAPPVEPAAVITMPAPPAEPARPAAFPPGLPEAQRDVYSTVYALADSGLDVTAIARRLSMTKGEIQLILGLRQAT